MKRTFLRSILRYVIPVVVKHDYETESAVITVPLQQRGQKQRLLLQVFNERRTEHMAFLGPLSEESTRLVVVSPGVVDILCERRFNHLVSMEACVDIAIDALESDYSWISKL